MDQPRALAAPPPRASRAHRRGASRLAWLLCAASAAQVAAGCSLAALNGLTLRHLFAELVVAVAVASATFTVVGALILRRYPGQPIGWLCCAAGLGNGLFAWSVPYARYALVTRPGALPGGEAALWLNLWAWVPVEATVLLFLPLLFPDGRLPAARWRPLPWLAATGLALFSAALAFGPNTDAFLPQVQNPFVLSGAQGALDLAGGAGGALTVASLLGAAGAAVARFRRARDVQRQQLKWVGFGAALLIAAYLAAAAIYLSGVDRSGLASGVLLALAFPCVPAATGIAILRFRLYDIDLLINRTLVYGALTAGVVGLYVGIVGYLGTISRAGGSLPVSLAATALVAVAFQPLRARLQRGVNRLLYGERDEPYAVLSRLGQRLEGTLAPESVLPTIVQTVREALKLPYAALTLRQDGGAAIVVASGDPTDEALRLPLTYQHATVGELALAPRAPGEPFSPADRRLLGDLARQAGVAAHAVLLAADLERSRRRIVVEREEARRRLGSDLHDGLGHRLAALVRRAEVAANLVEHDPDAARAALATLADQARGAVAEVRGLAHALHPPDLELLGLVGALRERAQQWSGPGERGPRVLVEAPEGLPPLPAAVEAAAYYIAQEALTNIQRHADARRCRVRIALVGSGAGEGAVAGVAVPLLELEIADDGRAPAPGAPGAGTGLGLRSMRARAAELGGSCVVEPGPAGGTRVRARLPCGEL